MNPESEEALLDSLASEYSDVYKELYGIRPSPTDRLTKVDDLEDALDGLYRELADNEAADEEISYYAELQRTLEQLTGRRELQPGPYDMEQHAKFSGMGRRFESRDHLKNKIRKIIKEVLSKR